MNYQNVSIDPRALTALEAFHMPEEYGFGSVMSPIMIYSDYENDAWGPLKMVPYGPLQFYPSAKVLHYGQEIFEGLKAYKTSSGEAQLFRAEQNAVRFNISAERMAMPKFPENLFLDAVKTITAFSNPFIPQKSGCSLYIRPFMFATEEALGIKPAAKLKFMVIASPSGAYLADSVEVLIERKLTRAAPGGTGYAKTGGNYAASLLASQKMKELGYGQILWLDGLTKSSIEELSGMNFFTVIDGELHTPAIQDTILSGITRNSLITLAKQHNLNVIERKIDISELIGLIKEGRATEAFACGTAAIVTPITALGEEDGEKYHFNNKTNIALALRKNLLDIQEGRKKGPDGWIEVIPSAWPLSDLKTG